MRDEPIAAERAGIFQAVFAGSPEPILLTSVDGLAIEANPAALALLGYRSADLPGLRMADILDPAPGTSLDDFCRLAETESWQGIIDLRRRDGQRIPCEVRGLTLSGAAGPSRAWYIREVAERHEQALSHARLAAIMTSCVDAVVCETLDGIITDWNPAAERLYGYSAAEAIGQPLHMLASAGREPEIRELLARVGGGESISNVETVRRTKDGQLIDVSLSLFPVRNDTGQIIAASAVARDIMAHKQMVEALRSSEAKYRTLLEHVPAAVYLLAADQKRIYFSPYIEAFTGYDPEEALATYEGIHWLDFVHPEDHERMAAEDARTRDAEVPFRGEYRVRRADGSYVWVQDECAPVFDADGALVAWQGVLLDISDRIAAEEEQARLAAIVASTKEAIFSTRQGEITSWNHGAERMFGYPAGEIIGRPVSVLLPGGQPEAELVQAWRAGNWAARIETTRVRRDGSTFDAAVSLSPIRDRNGVVIGVSSITQDISARKQAEHALQAALAEARAATRAKSLFLAMMTHELRTPLQAVLGYAGFLLGGPPDALSPEQRDDIDAIHRGAQRMVTLIEQLLDLSRMEAGRLELTEEPFDLHEIIEHVRQDVAPQAAAKALALNIQVSRRLAPIMGDPVRVRQILLNLVGNAVKFTDDGRIDVRVRQARDGIEVAVQDTGVGIAPDALPAIFDEFRQVGSNAFRSQGAGLGLAISKGLAEQMGGHIDVTSTPGVGSTFTLWLPAAPRPAT